VNEKPSPTYVDTVFNCQHSFIQNKHQTGFIQTNLKELKDQRVIFSIGKYKQDGCCVTIGLTTQQKPVLIII